MEDAAAGGFPSGGKKGAKERQRVKEGERGPHFGTTVHEVMKWQHGVSRGRVENGGEIDTSSHVGRRAGSEREEDEEEDEEDEVSRNRIDDVGGCKVGGRELPAGRGRVGR
ncbi:hypothetical protein K0M31_003080 [Melipona bicolor]|uniref:Uncharacterized protein n=1 Tax=Melipona bicolor TaxID=60889 RepID=A0AA40KQ80_9HYME|nr:hypothetical protein K0M31_003080 [Melipona bicolor]